MRILTLFVLSTFIANTSQARDAAYHGVIQRVVDMPSDGDLQQRAGQYGLNILNVLWEDTGRAAAPVASSRARSRDDVEVAVLGHGEDQDPFHELENLQLERDPNFPVRVTVQFYRATGNGVVSDQSLADVAKMIDRVYADADYVGSLVVPEGPRYRPTDWIKDHPNAYWNPWRTNVVTIAK